MNEILTPAPMLRVELLHPLVVHLPIVCLLLAGAIRAGAVAAKARPRWAFLMPASSLLLVVGAFGAWLAILTGNLAEDVVNRVICDPTVTARHEDFALYVAIGSTISTAIDLGGMGFLGFRLPVDVARFAVRLVSFVLLPALGIAIGFTAHLGASLTYQQGAAVYKPSDSCTEFEED